MIATTEQERFDKDFAVADQRVRAQKFEHVQNKWANLREERYQREVQRFENMERAQVRDAEILEVKKT